MLMTKERRPAFRTVEGWARSVLMEASAIHDCEEDSWAKDRADPHARPCAPSRPPGFAARRLSGDGGCHDP
jgi:hypothetical protein